jgi:hypothetical protein
MRKRAENSWPLFYFLSSRKVHLKGISCICNSIQDHSVEFENEKTYFFWHIMHSRIRWVSLAMFLRRMGRGKPVGMSWQWRHVVVEDSTTGTETRFLPEESSWRTQACQCWRLQVSSQPIKKQYEWRLKGWRKKVTKGRKFWSCKHNGVGDHQELEIKQWSLSAWLLWPDVARWMGLHAEQNWPPCSNISKKISKKLPQSSLDASYLWLYSRQLRTQNLSAVTPMVTPRIDWADVCLPLQGHLRNLGFPLHFPWNNGFRYDLLLFLI